MSDVFISHSSKDKEIADKVCQYLEEKGIGCWIAPRNIVPGSDWASAINDAITVSKVFLVIFTENSAKSHQVAREVALAENRDNVFVLPYKTDSTPLSGTFEYYLTGSHFITADYSRENYKLEELYAIISDVLNGKTPEVSPASHSEVITQKTSVNKKKINKKAFIIAASGLVIIIAFVVVILILSSSKAAEKSTDAVNDVTPTDIPPVDITSIEPVPSETEPSGEKNERKEKKDIDFKIYENDCEYSYLVDYIGEFNDFGVPDGEGEFSGHGLEVKADYSIRYTGSFKDGILDGTGTLTTVSSDGITIEYKGGFSRNQKSGKGIQTETHETGDLSQIIYDGSWENGSIKSGTQNIYYLDGAVETYTGDFDYNTRSGNGNLIVMYKTGDTEKVTVDGKWLYGDLHGEDITLTKYYFRGDYEEYIGQFEYGVFSGKNNIHIYHDVDGSKYERRGFFSEGEFVSGTFSEYDKDGILITTEDYESDTPAFRRQSEARDLLIEYIEKNGDFSEEQNAYILLLPGSDEKSRTYLLSRKDSTVPLSIECLKDNGYKAGIEYNSESKSYEIHIVQYDDSGKELRSLTQISDIETYSGYILEPEITDKKGFDDYSLAAFIEETQPILWVLNEDTTNFFNSCEEEFSWNDLGFDCW